MHQAVSSEYMGIMVSAMSDMRCYGETIVLNLDVLNQPRVIIAFEEFPLSLSRPPPGQALFAELSTRK